MELVKIRGEDSYEKYKDWIRRFRDNLYLVNFPDPNEREPFEVIEARLKKGGEWWPRTDMLMYIDGDSVACGCIADYYPECESIEVIYLVTDKEYREKGLAGKILDETFSLYPEALDMYVEADNPALVPVDFSPINPETRLKIYERLGFSIINIKYIQPPLAPGLDFDRKLLLMCRSKDSGLTKERLEAFLKSFYKGLNASDSKELHEMLDSLSN